MNNKKLLQSKTARAIVFLWFIVFPIVFITIPAVEMYMGEREYSDFPLWAFGVWVLGPLAAGIVIKNFFGSAGNETKKTEMYND
ncbi:MAG: hypothetical protein WBC71_03840 [Salaquimonas sp.]